MRYIFKSINNLILVVTNNELVEKIFLFEQEVKKKNPTLARNIDNAIIPLLSYHIPLDDASEEELLEITGMVQRV